MREIKFRAFHRKYKVVLPVWVIDFQFQRLQMWWNDTSEDSNNAWDSFSDVELMQYTGLKDKNGKEIYEGDIIRIRMYKGNYENYKITWINDYHEVEEDNPNIDMETAEFIAINEKEGIDFNWIDSSIWFKCEVIGNIYENPELMEVK